MRNLIAAGFLLLGIAGLAPGRALADDATDAAERWDAVRSAVYDKRPVQDAGESVQLNVPERAFDAWLIPVSVTLDPAKHFVALSLFVDNNPSPLVGTFRFGPAWANGPIKLKVRVQDPTLIHAVAEAPDGTLYTSARHIFAAGGCAAPVTGQMADIARMIGQMQLRRTRPLDGNVIASQLLISHPNFNGMQTGAKSMTIPARYLESIAVSTGGVSVFNLESGISLSEDPVISFAYTPAGNGLVSVSTQENTGAKYARFFEPLAE